MRSDIGVRVTLDRSLIKTPGSTGNKKGTPDAVLAQVDIMLTSKRFGRWKSEPVGEEIVNTPDLRCRARMELGTHARKNESSLAKHMSKLIPHMGAHIRAYRFLCFQTQLGYRPNDPITLDEVSEVIPMIIEQGWLKPRPRGDYEEYLSGGNLHKITKGFKGKSRLRALWDITGYALQAGTWTNPPTVEMHLYQMATFWSMKAPTVLPTLPGIGGEGTPYHQFDTPDIFWNSKYIEDLNVKRIVLEDEDKGESTSSNIKPKAVSKAPVITNQPWDPVLGDSPHAFAWWTLSKEETVEVIREQKKKTVSRPTPQIPQPPRVVKAPTTTSKRGTHTPLPKDTIEAKTAAIKAPAVSREPLTLPLPELTGPPGPRQPTVEYKGNAGVRQPSHVRGKKLTQGQTLRTPHGPSSLGKGTPSIPPETAVGAYRTDSADRSIVPQSQDQEPIKTQQSGDRSRSREPLRESAPVVPSIQPSATMIVPQYMLPIMAMQGIGHPSSDQPMISGVSGIPPPKAGEPSTHDFFESFTLAQDREARLRAVQQFTAELLNTPPSSGPSASQENPDQSQMPSEGTTEEQGKSKSQPVQHSPAESREPTPVRGEKEKDVVEPTPEPSVREEMQQAPSSTERGRQPSIVQRLKSYWPPLKSLSGSHRRPVSPTIPPRSKADPPPRRAISLPRIPGPEPAESSSNPATPGAISPAVADPNVQITAPTAAQSQDQPSAPEVTSDAETLALPGVPGADENGPPPSPIEEEPPSATDDPYVSTVEATTEGITSTETPQAPSPTEHESLGAPSARPQGFGGLVPVIPKPSTSEIRETASKSVTATTEKVSKEANEATASAPDNPATQPTVEIGTSQSSTGEADASKPPSGEAEPSKPSVEEKKSENPQTAPKAKAKSVSTRKQKETPKETPEQKEQREKAEKAAEELVQQEEAEKRKQEAKDAKSKKAAAENKEKAREAAAQQRKTKEQAEEAEQTVAQKRRIKAVIPENVPRDQPPPNDDDQPWQIYQYRPHIEATTTLVYEEEDSGVKDYDLESAYNLDVLGTRKLYNSGQATPVPESVKFLQNGTRRVREIRAEQIERIAAVQPIVPIAPHPCVVKGGLLMRVSTPYHKNGTLMLGTFPGMAPKKHKVVKPQLVPYLSLTAEIDKAQKMPDLLTHLAIHTAANAIGGGGTRAGNARADNKADWFTPEVLRAARVFLKELSTAQYTNTGATRVTKPGFIYYPSELTEVVDEANKGRWVHLVSLGLQVSHIQWTVMRTLPFYVRGLLREVPIALIPDLCTIAALTDSDLEVLMDQHLMLWVRSKTY